MKLFALSLLALVASPAAFAEQDLDLPGEKWLAKFDRFICVEGGPAVAAPAGFAALNLKVEGMSSDSTLDNGLIKATFEEEGKVCRYSGIVLADNDAKTVKLVTSRSFAVNADADCARGKEVLDRALADNTYLYFGHPHNLSILAPVEGAEEVCGAGNSRVGITFVVSGRKKP